MKTTLIALLALALMAGGYYWYMERGEEVFVDDEEEMSNDNTAPMQGKLDINAVCEGALAYMSFPDGASAEVFVEECKAGEHPEVIERYKSEMNVGADVAI